MVTAAVKTRLRPALHSNNIRLKAPKNSVFPRGKRILDRKSVV